MNFQLLVLASKVSTAMWGVDGSCAICVLGLFLCLSLIKLSHVTLKGEDQIIIEINILYH